MAEQEQEAQAELTAWICPICKEQVHAVPSGRGHYHDKRFHFDNWVDAVKVPVVRYDDHLAEVAMIRKEVLGEVREALEGAGSIEAAAASLHDWREQREPSGPVEESPDPDCTRREPEWWEQMVAAGRFPASQKEIREEAIAVLASAIATLQDQPSTLDHDREGEECTCEPNDHLCKNHGMQVDEAESSELHDQAIKCPGSNSGAREKCSAQPKTGETPEVREQLNPFPISWRVGRKLGRTLYAQLGPEPSDDDPFLGLMETPMLAAQVVAIVNRSKAADRDPDSSTGRKGGA